MVNDAAPNTSAAPAMSRAKPRARRWLRRGVYAIGAAALVASAGLWLVTRSWFLVGQIAPHLSQTLGGDVHIGMAVYEGGGRFVLHDFTLRATGHAGPAGRIAHVGRAVIDVDAGRLWLGNVNLKSVELHDMLLRLSEDAHDSGSFNFMALDPVLAEREDRRVAPPKVRIHRAAVEFGSHDGDAFEMRGRRLVAGVMHPDADTEHWFNFQLSEIDDAGRGIDGGLLVNGRWNAATHEYAGRIDGIELDRATYDTAPHVVRLWWDRMELEGRLADAFVQWDADRGLHVECRIEDAGLTLPVEAGDWARYHGGRIIGYGGPQRMRVHSGTIALQDDELVLERLEGELTSPDPNGASVTVPYTVSVSLPRLPTLDWQQREQWMDEVVAAAPFKATFRLQDFRVVPDRHGRVPAVDLPLRIAQTLETFALADWTLSTHIEISRSEPTTNTDGRLEPAPIKHSGQLYIRNASGSYANFPYPLTGVDAYLNFDQDRIKIEYITGQATDGATVRLEGEITPPGRDAAVEVRLRGRNMEIDDRLRYALPPHQRGVYDALLHEPSYEALRAEGLLGDFELGGMADLDLIITRLSGENQPTQIRGTVKVQSLNAVYDGFPYPFTVRDGLVQWEHDRVTFASGKNGPGLPIVTLGGGRGFITGGFRSERVAGGHRLMPDIGIEVSDDSMNELVYAAIPLAGGDGGHDDRRSQSADLLHAIGIDGPLSYAGVIQRTDEGEIDYRFDVYLANGTAEPTDELAEVVGGAGLLWSSAWKWHDANAHVRVTPRAIELVELTAQRSDGRVAADGIIDRDRDPADVTLNLHFNDLELGQHLIDVVPTEGVELARTMWERYQPSGSFNAHLQYHQRGGKSYPPRLHIQPAEINVRVDDEDVTFTHASGGVTLHAGTVTLDRLELDVSRRGASDGRVLLRGSYGTSGDGEKLLAQGTWSGGRFDSPLILEMLRLIGADEPADHYSAYAPSGEFDAQFEYASPRGQGGHVYGFSIQPNTLRATLPEGAVDIQFEPPSLVRLTPGRIELDQVSGRHETGAFAVDGTITFDDLIDARLELGYDGDLAGVELHPLLPQQLRDLLKAINFRDGRGTQVTDASLRVAQVRRGHDKQWRGEFDGKLLFHGAAMDTGVYLREIDGSMDVQVRIEPGDAPLVNLDAAFDRLRAMDREVTNVTAPDIALSPDGLTLHVRNISGNSYGGLVRAAAQVGVGENRRYAASIDYVGVSLHDMLNDDSERPRVQRVARQRQPRGELFGSISVEGLRDQPETRTGRGSVRAVGGSLANVPFVLQLMHVLQLTAPIRGDLDHADLAFYIDGDKAVFERILLESTLGGTAVLQLIGSGDMDINSFELNTHFRSRGGMLLIRDLVGGLSDQLFMIEVTGTLREPKARVVPLPGLTQPETAARTATTAGTPR